MRAIDTPKSFDAAHFVDASEWPLVIAAVVVLLISVATSILY